VLQELFQAKWLYTVEGTESAYSTSTWQEYRALEEDSVEVLFLGTSHVYHAIDPMYIYENSGITSYAIDGPGMRMDLSYLSLEEALKTQSPSVVFFDMSAIHWHKQQSEARVHKITDQLSWSKSLLEFALDTDSDELSTLDVLFPLLRYHSRWEELSQDDFDYLTDDLPETYVRGHFITYRTETAEFRWDEDVKFSLSARNEKYFNKIVELCKENDIQLILYKIPSPSWYHTMSEGAAQMAEEAGVPYLELYYKIDEIGLDLTTDFKDSEDHLNQRGAEKLADYLIGYMNDNFDLTDQRNTNQQWDEDLIEYNKVKQAVEELWENR
jgi:hypothetical protein